MVLNLKNVLRSKVLIILFFLLTSNLHAKNLKNEKSIEVPRLKEGEYAIFLNDTYKVFKTKRFEELEIEVSCFKKNKPRCKAFDFSKIKPKEIKSTQASMNNFAAIHCADISGRNLIALDSKRNEYNFCYFKDGSMANSWSIYFKHHSVPIVK
mgnify:FL=1